MNIINKTLLPIENLPEGEAILNISIYDVDNEAYLTGTDLANAYSVSPLKPTYSIGETVSITINSYFGTVEERTFTRVVDQPITNLEFTIVGSIHQVVQQNSTNYSNAWAFLYNNGQTTTLNQRLTSTNFVLEGWSLSMYDSTNRQWQLPQSNTTNNANLRFSSRQNQINVFYDSNVYIKQIVKWGGYRPTTYPYNNWKLPTNSTITMDQFYPSKIPSVWTSLSGILVTFPNATDIPAGWDVTNITNIRGIFSTTITNINTYPSRLLSKAYNVLTDLFRYKKLGVNVDLSLVDYSKATALGIYVGQNYYSEYYDKMLRKWVETTPETRSISVTIQAPYTAEGEVYRNILIERGWVITDLGLIAEHTTNKFIFKDATSGAIIPNEEVTITRRNVPMYLRVGDYAYYDFESENYRTYTNQMYQTSTYGVTERTVTLQRKSRTLTVEVYPSEIPSTEYTITKNPNQETYVAGDVVEVKLTSPTYENQTKMVTIGNEDATVSFDLEFNYTPVKFTFLRGYVSSTDLTEIIRKGTIEIYLDGQLYRVYNNRNEISVPRNKVLTYRILSIDGYPQDYFKVAEGTIQIDNSGEAIFETVYMKRHNLLINVRTFEGSTITFEPNKPTFESKDVVLVTASKDGHQTVTKTIMMEGVDVTIDLYPRQSINLMTIEYEYLESTTEYGFMAWDILSEPSYRVYIFDTIVNGQVFRNKSSFTKQEILDLDAVKNGKVTIQVATILNERYDDGDYRFPEIGGIYATNPNVAVKVWVRTLPNWYQRFGNLFYRVDVQYCVQPHNDSIIGFSNNFKTCQDLLTNIGKGEDSALNLSAIADWDFNRYDNYRRLFKGSYINFRPNRIIDFSPNVPEFGASTNHYFDILANGEIVDPAKYDDFLRGTATVPSIQFYMNMGRSKYTVNAINDRNTITQRLELVDGGLIDPLTYKIKVNTNVEGATVTMSPQAQRYELGSTVAITVAKAGYETQVINHTVTKYIESNVISVDLQVKTYSPTVIVKDEFGALVPNATITMSPNKVSYELYEEVTIRATKDGYSIDETQLMIVDGDNVVNLVIQDISMYMNYTVGATGTPKMTFYLMNDIPVKITNFDGTETLYGTDQPYREVELTGTLEQGASRTIQIKPIGHGNVGIAYIGFGDSGYRIPSNKNTLAINKWGRVTHANMLAYLFAETPNYISYIAKLPNTTTFDYLFFGLSGKTVEDAANSILLDGALAEWTNVSIGSGISMFASGSMLEIDPRGFDLTNATDITNIFDGTVIAPINGENAYDLWLIHLAQNYLNKALSFKIFMKYTSAGATARQQLVNAGWTIQDLGLEIPNTLVVNTTPADATVVRTPNFASYEVGEIVTISVSKPEYVTKTITHTIESGVNTVDVVLDLAGFSITPMVYAMNTLIEDATITRIPNKSVYQNGDEVMVVATKDGYSVATELLTITGNVSPKLTLLPSDKLWLKVEDIMTAGTVGFSTDNSTLSSLSFVTYDEDFNLINTQTVSRSGSSGSYTYYGNVTLATRYIGVSPLSTASATANKSFGSVRRFVHYWGTNTTTQRAMKLSILNTPTPKTTNDFGVFYSSTTSIYLTTSVVDLVKFEPVEVRNTSLAAQISNALFNRMGNTYAFNVSSLGVLEDRFGGNYTQLFTGTAIDHTLEFWDFSNVTNMSNFMTVLNGYGGFTTPELYDRLLNAWIQYPERRPATALAINFGASKYTSAGASARAQLVALGFTITDGGLQS